MEHTIQATSHRLLQEFDDVGDIKDIFVNENGEHELNGESPTFIGVKIAETADDIVSMVGVPLTSRRFLQTFRGVIDIKDDCDSEIEIRAHLQFFYERHYGAARSELSQN